MELGHGFYCMPLAIGRKGNDNQLVSPNNPQGGFVGSCPECTGLIGTSLGISPAEFDTDMSDDTPDVINRPRTASHPFENVASPQDYLEAGVIGVFGGSNSIQL